MSQNIFSILILKYSNPYPHYRPHWGKEMPDSVGEAPLVEYLQIAYAKELAMVHYKLTIELKPFYLCFLL